MSNDDGLLTLQEWGTLTTAERRIYLAALNAQGRARQAQHLADETAQAAATIVAAWQAWGYLSPAEALATRAATV